jgi:hypothetical protein
MNQISVIIVSWNALGYLRDCLASVRRLGGPDVGEIIVVDNASSDGSSEMVAKEFPEVTLIRSPKNLGFAGANNVGIQRASCPFLALINSDIVLHEGCFQRLLSLVQSRPEVALAAPKIIGRDGFVQYTCGRLPTLWNTACRLLALDRILSRWRLFSGFQMRGWSYDRTSEVQTLTGCFWLARASAVREVGGLDERFFFYAEDIDWCKRFLDAGWKNIFVAEASATHFGGASSANAPLRFSIEMLRGNLIYWNKHHGSLGRFAYFLLATLQQGVRLLAHLLLRIACLGDREQSRHRIKEDMTCLRWLLTGKGI